MFMKFQEFIKKQAILPFLEANCPREAFERMLESLIEAGALSREGYDDALKALLRREEIGTTAIGDSRMFPHAKTTSVKKTVGVVAVCGSGFDADSMDGSKIKFIFLLLSPHDQPGNHLRCLERYSRETRDKDFLVQLLESETREEIWEALVERDEALWYCDPAADLAYTV